MSNFGDTLFGGSRFIRWSLSPFVLLFALLMPFLVPNWTWQRVALIAGMEIMAFALFAGFWLPQKYGRLAFRIVTGLVFLGYAFYLVDKVFVSDVPFKLTGGRAEASPRNSVLGFITIGLPCLWYSLFGRFSFGRSAQSSGFQIEQSYVVTMTEVDVSCQLPDGQIQRVRWSDLQSVIVQTTSDGPALPDVFWILSGISSRCIIPQGATGDRELLECLLKLPGFDNEALIAAMSSTDDQEFMCWRRPAEDSV